MNYCEIDRTSDAMIINDINPFVFGSDAMNLPGAVSGDYDFSFYDNKQVDDEDEDPDKEISPICRYTSTAGYRTIDSCKPLSPNCPINRPLLPERDINPGMWYYNRLAYDEDKKEKSSPRNQRCTIMYALLVLLIILLIVKI